MKTYKECCEYIGISEELPKCHVDERQIQAAYKLRVCMRAWNKQDGFEPDEKAIFNRKNVGYTPYFYFRNGSLMLSGSTASGSYAGIVFTYASLVDASAYAFFGLRLPLKTRERAIEFGETFIETFNELL